MRTSTVIICCGILWTGSAIFPAGAAEKPRELGDLGQVGTVAFPTSCDPALQDEFNRALALLHSFFYDEARRVFSDIAQRDPQCAMAHWGVAMTYYHPIWTAPDSTEVAAGLKAIEKALAAPKKNERELGFIRAAEAFYKNLDAPQPGAAAAPSCHALVGPVHTQRAAAFRREMEKLARRDPQDLEASAFYALSLLATAPPGDLAQPKQAAEILEKWYATNPNHPGLVHYLIHSYDYPELAPRGLPAAQAYASIAPWVPHALHMPSHIFTRLGMWKESVESNQASAEAARRYASLHHADAASFEELHALDYMMYGYLQTAQDAKAKKVMERLDAIQATYPAIDFAAAYAFGAIPARYALERRQWKEAAALQIRPMPFWTKLPFAEGHIVYARAVGAARSGDLASAETAVKRLQELSKAMTEPRFKYFAQQMDIQRDAAQGLVALAKGEKEQAVSILRRAAAREDSLGKHPVSPGAMLPVRELLAETLVETGKPAEALKEFAASMQVNPGRFNGVYGAAHAAEKAGQNSEARRYYQELLVLGKNSEASREELHEAQAFVAKR